MEGGEGIFLPKPVNQDCHAQGNWRMRRLILASVLIILLMSLSRAAFNLERVQASGPIYIRADGSIDPPDALISTTDQTTYTLMGNINSDTDGIVVERGNIILDGASCRLQGPGKWLALGHGIEWSLIDNVTIKDITISDFKYPIFMSHSSYNTLIGNDIANNYYGIQISLSDYTDISGNHFYNNLREAINLGSTSYANISGNHIEYHTGIKLEWSHYFSISGNNITSRDGRSEGGIWLSQSWWGNISGNTFINTGLFVKGDNDILVENNTVNGKPLVYLVGVSNYTIEDAGQVVLVGCEYVRVEDLDLSRVTTGIELWETQNSNITGVLFRGNRYGIYVMMSDNIRISGNVIAHCRTGIYSMWSGNNSISENIIADNIWGIDLRSRDNVIFHNIFLRNDWISDIGYSTWDDGYPSGGNYWNDYDGTDLFNGPYQNQSGSDGIGDTPYTFALGMDRYPVIKPFAYWNYADLNHDLVVDILDVVMVAGAYDSIPSDPNWDPRCDLVEPFEAIDIFDVVNVAIAYGETFEDL